MNLAAAGTAARGCIGNTICAGRVFFGARLSDRKGLSEYLTGLEPLDGIIQTPQDASFT